MNYKTKYLKYKLKYLQLKTPTKNGGMILGEIEDKDLSEETTKEEEFIKSETFKQLSEELNSRKRHFFKDVDLNPFINKKKYLELNVIEHIPIIIKNLQESIKNIHLSTSIFALILKGSNSIRLGTSQLIKNIDFELDFDFKLISSINLYLRLKDYDMQSILEEYKNRLFKYLESDEYELEKYKKLLASSEIKISSKKDLKLKLESKLEENQETKYQILIYGFIVEIIDKYFIIYSSESIPLVFMNGLKDYYLNYIIAIIKSDNIEIIPYKITIEHNSKYIPICDITLQLDESDIVENYKFVDITPQLHESGVLENYKFVDYIYYENIIINILDYIYLYYNSYIRYEKKVNWISMIEILLRDIYSKYNYLTCEDIIYLDELNNKFLEILQILIKKINEILEEELFNLEDILGISMTLTNRFDKYLFLCRTIHSIIIMLDNENYEKLQKLLTNFYVNKKKEARATVKFKKDICKRELEQKKYNKIKEEEELEVKRIKALEEYKEEDKEALEKEKDENDEAKDKEEFGKEEMMIEEEKSAAAKAVAEAAAEEDEEAKKKRKKKEKRNRQKIKKKEQKKITKTDDEILKNAILDTKEKEYVKNDIDNSIREMMGQIKEYNIDNYEFKKLIKVKTVAYEEKLIKVKTLNSVKDYFMKLHFSSNKNTSNKYTKEFLDNYFNFIRVLSHYNLLKICKNKITNIIEFQSYDENNDEYEIINYEKFFDLRVNIYEKDILFNCVKSILNNIEINESNIINNINVFITINININLINTKHYIDFYFYFMQKILEIDKQNILEFFGLRDILEDDYIKDSDIRVDNKAIYYETFKNYSTIKNFIKMKNEELNTFLSEYYEE